MQFLDTQLMWCTSCCLVFFKLHSNESLEVVCLLWNRKCKSIASSLYFRKLAMPHNSPTCQAFSASWSSSLVCGLTVLLTLESSTTLLKLLSFLLGFVSSGNSALAFTKPYIELALRWWPPPSGLSAHVPLALMSSHMAWTSRSPSSAILIFVFRVETSNHHA